MAAKDGILSWIASEKPRSKTGDGINLDMKIMTSGDALQIDVNSSILTGTAFKIYDDNGSANLLTVDKSGNVVAAGKVTGSAATFTNAIEVGGGTNIEVTGTKTASAPTNVGGLASGFGCSGFLLAKVSGTVVKIPYFTGQ